PTPTRQLEPPGFFALHYGRRTPISVILAHLLYGGILGAFYRLHRSEPTRRHSASKLRNATTTLKGKIHD
ncbi:MAG TPA: hypothetical protein VGR29_05595, partial [Thermomicrobiales bacterium]|nr:hypothetical protein [Thermomicrobiales bacterium]